MTTLTAAEIVALQETLAAAVALAADLPANSQSAITAAAVQAAYAQSLVLTATPPPTPNLPAAPTSFAAAVSGTTVGLTWVNAPGTTTGAVIKRDGTQIATVLAGVATYTDQGVSVTTHTYTVANTNAFGTGAAASTSAVVASAATLTLASIATQNLVMGAAFTLTPVAAGGTAPYTWATSAALPKGLVLNVTSNTTATITGTPTAAGTTSVTLTVTDSTAGTPQTASRTFSIVVAAPPSLTITEPTGFPITVSVNSTTAAPTSATQPHAYAQVGDLAIANIAIYSASVSVTGLSSPNTGAWTRSKQLQDTLLGFTLEQWTAPVTIAAVVDTVTIAYTGPSTGGGDVWLDSKEGAGPTSMWQIVTSGTSTSGNPSGGVTTMTYPSLVSATTSNPQFYEGFLISGNVAEGGATSGCVYVDAASGNEMVYKLSVGSAATLAPTSTQLAGVYDAIAVIYELTSSGLGSSVLAVNTVTTQNDTVNVAAAALTLATTGGSGTKTFAVTAGTLPTGMALSGTTGVISGTPTKVGSSAITITASDSSSPVQTATVTFTINVAAAAAPPAAGKPNVPTGTTVPTNVLMNADFVAMYNPTAKTDNSDNLYGGLDLTTWQPWMYGATSQNPGQTFALKDSSGTPLTMVKADGCHIGFDASNQTSGCIASAKGAAKAPGTGTYNGFNFGPPTASTPIFLEFLVQFINNGTQLPGWQAVWAAGDPTQSGFANWPACGEWDLVETGLAHPGKPGWTAIAGFFASGAFAGKQNNGPGGTAESVTTSMLNGAVTIGMLWTTTAVTYFYDQANVGSQLISNGSAGYNNFGVKGYVPSQMFPVVFAGASGESPDLSGRTDMILKRITVWQ